MSQIVGKCPECGPTTEVEVEFPVGAECQECESEVEKVKVVSDEVYQELVED